MTRFSEDIIEIVDAIEEYVKLIERYSRVSELSEEEFKSRQSFIVNYYKKRQELRDKLKELETAQGRK